MARSSRETWSPDDEKGAVIMLLRRTLNCKRAYANASVSALSSYRYLLKLLQNSVMNKSDACSRDLVNCSVPSCPKSGNAMCESHKTWSKRM